MTRRHPKQPPARRAIAAGEAPAVDHGALDRGRLLKLAREGAALRALERRLAARGKTVVDGALGRARAFYQWVHYPMGDVHDPASHAQYYYHAHDLPLAQAEHGHFHLFLRPAGMPAGIKPARLPPAEPTPANERLCHLIAVSIGPDGMPFRLFTTNQWVTGETFYRAADVIRMLDRFAVRKARPRRPSDRYLGHLVALFQPRIAALLRARDAALQRGQSRRQTDAHDDRRLEVLSWCAISIDAECARVRAALNGRRRSTTASPASGSR